MERIIIKHLSGSKANQTEEFPLNLVRELTLGRDVTSMVKYDPDRDDLVGRHHARIAPDVSEPFQFTITDLNSRNGTFVNRQKIVGTTRINPGDVIQLGPGGPEFMFDMEPHPEVFRPTRVATAYQPVATPGSVPMTRVGVLGSSSISSSVMPASQPLMAAPAALGKETVDRMIIATQSQTRKQLIIAGTVILSIIAMVAGYLIYANRQQQAATEQAVRESTKPISQVASDVEAMKNKAAMSPAEITAAYSKAVVQLEVAWKLIETTTGKQVYHYYYNGAPLYVQLTDGSKEPVLTGNSISMDGSQNQPIGGRHMGSGFVIAPEGYIMTDRHVAATWHTAYQFPVTGGTLLVLDNDNRTVVRQQAMTEVLLGWVPANGQVWADQNPFIGRSLIGEKRFEGSNIVLDVAFPNKSLRTPATLSRVSENHDVAIIKVNIPTPQDNVPQLFDNYEAIKVGDSTIVMGYPSVSPPVYGKISSEDVFNRQTQAQTIPNPTLSVGNIGRILRSNERPDRGRSETYSTVGDLYQLTINSTGAGNSGGPVFDDHGRVIAILNSRAQAGGAAITFAVPIRYGKELLE